MSMSYAVSLGRLMVVCSCIVQLKQQLQGWQVALLHDQPQEAAQLQPVHLLHTKAAQSRSAERPRPRP